MTTTAKRTGRALTAAVSARAGRGAFTGSGPHAAPRLSPGRNPAGFSAAASVSAGLALAVTAVVHLLREPGSAAGAGRIQAAGSGNVPGGLVNLAAGARW